MFKKHKTDPVKPTDDLKDEIVFLIFEIRKNKTTGETNIELTKKINKTGKLKTGSENGETMFQNYLTLDVYTDDKLTSSAIIEHPLYKNMEYLNDEKVLEVKSVSLDSAEFFTRVQIKGTSNKLKISETLKDKTIRELTTITL